MLYFDDGDDASDLSEQDEWDAREMANLRSVRRRDDEYAVEAEIALWACATDSLGTPIDGTSLFVSGVDGIGAGTEFVPVQPVRMEHWQVGHL